MQRWQAGQQDWTSAASRAARRLLAILCLAGLCVPAFAAQVALAWDPSPDPSATGYYLYYGTASRSYPNRIDAGSQTSATVQNLSAGQTYYFAVTARNAALAESGYSNEVSTTIPANATSTALASSTNPSLSGVAVTFTANVTGSAPTGTVNFRNGSTSIPSCSAVVLSGSGNTRAAACTTTSLAIGSRSITAVYSGNAANAPSTSATLVQTVQAATTTTLASSRNPSVAGESVTFTATVSGSSPTGTVAFRDGANTIGGCGTAALAGTGNTRTATCTTSVLAVGTRAMTASYSGNATNAASTSAILAQSVQSAPVTATFADVPPTHWAFAAVEAVAYNAISLGCATEPRKFCPDEVVGRDEMAVFLERAMRGVNFAYSPTGTRFADVPLTHWAVGPIEQLYLDGITGGCATSPLRYCPSDDLARAAMAVFLLKARLGALFHPGSATGTVFADVPATHPQAAWIEELYRLGYTTGCSSSPRNFCPSAAVTRAEMAVFLQRVFELAGPPP